MKKVCGIYCIENIINNKKYVGQSINIYKRWACHKNNLDRHENENSHFQSAWDKYGKKNFIFYILEECPKELLNEKEKYWIKKLSTLDRKYGYNKTEGGLADPLITYSKLERSQMISSSCCHILTEKQVKEIIERFLSGDYNSNIAKDYNVGVATINDIRNHRTWKYLTDGLDFGSSSGKTTGKKRAYPVDMYSEDGKLINSFPDGVTAEKVTGISRKLISAVCHGDKRIAKGYIWRLHGHPFDEYNINNLVNKQIIQIDKNGNIIAQYPSITQASKETGIKTVNLCIQGKIETAGGYYWKTI